MIKVIFTVIFSLLITQKSSAFFVYGNSVYERKTISKLELKDIFYGHKVLDKKGKRLRAILFGETRELKVFFSEILNSTEHFYEDYWRRKLFAGNGTPPLRSQNLEEVLALIHKSHSIIIVSSKKLSDNKLLAIEVLDITLR